MIRNFVTGVFFAGLMGGMAASLQAAPICKSDTQKSCANFNGKGELVRPTGYREWIYVGAPVTPNDLNDGKAAFPEFHNVYIDPASWSAWKKTGEFRDGTIVIKELVSVGSKKTFSGNGYFMGEYLGLEAMVKSKKHFPKSDGNWGFFRFTNDDYKGLKTVASELPQSVCLSCHTPNAQYDNIFIQHYPVLRAAKAMGESGTGGK